MGRKIDPILATLLIICITTITGSYVWWQNISYFEKSQIPLIYIYNAEREIKNKFNEIVSDLLQTYSTTNNNELNSSNPTQTKITINSQPVILDVFYKGKTATSQYRKQVLNYLDYLKFPQSLRRGLIIVIASPDFTNQVFYFEKMELPFRSPDNSNPASIKQICYGQNCLNLIAMKSDLFPSNFYASLTHELGHAIGEALTAEDWQKWKNLRGNPLASPIDTPGRDWKLSQFEDFAETYKVIFGNYQGSDQLNWKNKTLYGKQLCSNFYAVVNSSKESTATEAYEKMLEKIRAERALIEKQLTDPECYTNYSYKDMPPNKATKDFMNQLLLRLQ